MSFSQTERTVFQQWCLVFGFDKKKCIMQIHLDTDQEESMMSNVVNLISGSFTRGRERNEAYNIHDTQLSPAIQTRKRERP